MWLRSYQVCVRYHVQGLVVNNYKTDLPVKKGLSSSAAVCVLAARAFNRVYAPRPRCHTGQRIAGGSQQQVAPAQCYRVRVRVSPNPNPNPNRSHRA